jgi:hypothetical protein
MSLQNKGVSWYEEESFLANLCFNLIKKSK